MGGSPGYGTSNLDLVPNFSNILPRHLGQLTQHLPFTTAEVEESLRSPTFKHHLEEWKKSCFDKKEHAEWLLRE